MEITIEKTTVKKVKLSKQKADVVMIAINELLEDMCEKNYEQFLKLVPKLTLLAAECAEGHGVMPDLRKLSRR